MGRKWSLAEGTILSCKWSVRPSRGVRYHKIQDIASRGISHARVFSKENVVFVLSGTLDLTRFFWRVPTWEPGACQA